jgi:hypothetical protein
MYLLIRPAANTICGCTGWSVYTTGPSFNSTSVIASNVVKKYSTTILEE